MTASTDAPPPAEDTAEGRAPVPAAAPRRGQVLELRITDLARAGRGVARHAGLVLFVDGALPGERVRARVTEVRKAFAEAATVAILDPSPHRPPPLCRHFGECGGCDLQHLAIEAQGEAKRRQLEAALRRIAGLATATVGGTVRASEPYGYRFRMDFDWRPGDSGPILGLHRRHRGDAVVPLEECRIAGAVTADILRWAPGEAARRRLDAFDPDRRRGLLRRLSIQEARRTREVLVSVETGRGDPPALAAWAGALARRFPRVVGVARSELGRDGTPAGKSILHGRDYLFEEVETDRFRIPSDAFFQPNPAAGALVRRHAVEALATTPGRRVLELYGGVGFFTVAAVRAGLRVTMVESVRSACAAARENLGERGDSWRIVEGDVARRLPALLEEDWDAILVDPPRTGLPPEVTAGIAGARVTRLVYVSCDPGTLARDLGTLTAAGWRLSVVTPFDQFPQTEHLEAVAVLER
ncbi:MAG TPA: 23S rRNA (uracil(1939)-C(5))-methyltransferase RlmD [Dongiaceae bacterium]|nr:23S rRNA (uracil(1939)-C(5))-methyltransferase RlmD [Dongiaceae bacterium]